MDAAWKVGVKSPEDDWELRMSLRSFWTNYPGAARYWIIGYIPPWIDASLVSCLPFPDPYRSCKDANLLHKALRLAMEPALSDPFLFCSDDQLLLQPSTDEDFELWEDGEIPHKQKDDFTKWQSRLFNTGAKLREAGFPARNFDVHMPCPLQKEWIREALRFDFATKPGMCVHSTVLNGSRVRGVPFRRRAARAWLGEADHSPSYVNEGLRNFRFASLTDKSLDNASLVEQVEELFPKPAPWEQDGATWTSLTQRRRAAATSAD